MSVNVVEFIACPAPLVTEALTLVLRDVAPEHREVVAPRRADDGDANASSVDGLWIARRGKQLLAATWAQRQPGNTAILWPPQSSAGMERELVRQLCQRAVDALDQAGIDMTQVVLPDRRGVTIPDLESVGFQFLADLLYLKWEAPPATSRPARQLSSQSSGPLRFEPYHESLRGRLIDVVERSYEGTQDCAAMNGMRRMDDVVAGYQATGVFRPELWTIVSADEHDVGALLLADHPGARHLELLYMGLAPEARGRGWGAAIVRHAQQISLARGVDRLVLAVDAANRPALAVYRDAGFRAWDERSVFVRPRHPPRA